MLAPDPARPNAGSGIGKCAMSLLFQQHAESTVLFYQLRGRTAAAARDDDDVLLVLLPLLVLLLLVLVTLFVLLLLRLVLLVLVLLLLLLVLLPLLALLVLLSTGRRLAPVGSSAGAGRGLLGKASPQPILLSLLFYI